MNNRYQQQNTHRSQQNGYQQNRSQHADFQRYQRNDLERELRQLQRQLAFLDATIDALGTQGRQLEADIQAHDQAIPAAVALEIGRAITNAIGIPFLPPAYRSWHYKRERLLQAEGNLRYRAIGLKAQRDAMVQQIEQILIDIDLLKYS